MIRPDSGLVSFNDMTGFCFSGTLPQLKQFHSPTTHMKTTPTLSLLLAAATALGSLQQSRAASATWNGTTDAVWATDTNWSATPAPGTGDTATFNNAGNTNTTLDLGAGVTVGNILFGSSSVAAYTIGANGAGNQTLNLAASGTITANSTITANQLFNANLGLAGNATFTNSDTGSKVTFAGGISGSSAGAKTLTINSTTGGIDVSGAITNGSATSLALVKSGNGNLTLTGANTYNGTTTVGAVAGQGGSLIISGSGSIAPTTGATLSIQGNSLLQYESSATSKFGAMNVGTGGTSNSGTLNQTNGTINASSMTLGGGNSGGYGGTVSLGSASGNASVLNISGDVSVGASGVFNSSVTVNGTGTLNVTGSLRMATSSNRDSTGTITQNGTVSAASLSLSGDLNDVTTRIHTSVYNLNGGTLSVGSIRTGAVLSVNGTISNTFNFNGGTLKATSNNATFWANSSYTTANVKDGGAKIDTNGFDITIAQPLVHFAGATTDTLTKNGAGNLTLTGNNTFTGATAVNVGTLIVSGGGVINTSSQVAVAGGATLTQDGDTALTAPLSLAENSTINGAGTFTTTNLTIVGDLTGGTFSSINSPATFAPSGSLAFTLTNTEAGSYDLFSTSPASFSFTSVSVGALSLIDSGGTFSANDGSFAYTFVNGTDVLEIVAIPEPGTWVLIGTGLAFLLYRKPRRFEA